MTGLRAHVLELPSPADRSTSMPFRSEIRVPVRLWESKPLRPLVWRDLVRELQTAAMVDGGELGQVYRHPPVFVGPKITWDGDEPSTRYERVPESRAEFAVLVVEGVAA